MATPLHLSQLERAFYVDRVKHVFNRHDLRPVLGDDGREVSEYLFQLGGHGRSRFQLDGAIHMTNQLSLSRLFHHAEAGVLTAAIDSQDTH